jgi:hypothetical protein
MFNPNSSQWVAIREFISLVTKLFGIAKAALDKMDIGMEIFSWMADDGEKNLIGNVTRLGEEFLAAVSSRVIDDHTVEVNLLAKPALPRVDGKVKISQRLFGVSGLVVVQKRSDGELYIRGKKVSLIRYNDWIYASDKFSSPDALILDALLKWQHLVPDSWKEDERGNKRFIVFNGTTYYHGHGFLSRCFLHVGEGKWRDDYKWGDLDKGPNDYVAAIEK